MGSFDPKTADLAALQAYVAEEGSSDVETVKVKENAISELSGRLVAAADSKALASLLHTLRPFFNGIPKAKTAKLVRSIIDSIAKIPGSTQLQVEVCKEQVEWARTEKRTFLRQRIELRLASLYLESSNFQEALTLIAGLLSEVKKLDDKLLLVDIYLLESRAHYLVRNLAKARAALTAARTAANAIYVPLLLQAEIDCMSGTLSAEEKDFKTGFSYFFEAFEQSSSLGEPKALDLLKYMLLCKIMMNEAGDVPGIISSKAGLKYTGRHVDAMKAVAKAAQDRSLAAFQEVLSGYNAELVGDALIASHLSALYDTLLEQNLVRLIEPFSRVEIAHVASLISLPTEKVEAKLSQMILDKKFNGTLDQGAGFLEVFEAQPQDGVYSTTLDVFESMGRVVDTLYGRFQKLAAV